MEHFSGYEIKMIYMTSFMTYYSMFFSPNDCEHDENPVNNPMWNVNMKQNTWLVKYPNPLQVRKHVGNPRFIRQKSTGGVRGVGEKLSFKEIHNIVDSDDQSRAGREYRLWISLVIMCISRNE